MEYRREIDGLRSLAVLPELGLRKLDVQATISLGQLTVSKLPIESASLKASAKGGLLDLQELRHEVLEGEAVEPAAA